LIVFDHLDMVVW